MKIRNISGHAIEQLFEGKRYRWPKHGSVMTLPDHVGAWMLSKLNSPDANQGLKEDRKAKSDDALRWVEMVASKPGDQTSENGEVVAEDPPEEKKKELPKVG